MAFKNQLNSEEDPIVDYNMEGNMPRKPILFFILTALLLILNACAPINIGGRVEVTRIVEVTPTSAPSTPETVVITATPEPTLAPSPTARVVVVTAVPTSTERVVVVTATSQPPVVQIPASADPGVTENVSHFCDPHPVPKWTIDGGVQNAGRGFEVTISGMSPTGIKYDKVQIASGLLNAQGHADGNDNHLMKGTFSFYLENYTIFQGERSFDMTNVKCP